MTEAEIDISLGFISLFKKSLNGFHDADKVVLHIKSASAPDELAVVIAAERLMSPVTLCARLDRNDILMRKQSYRLEIGILALPAIEQARLGDILALESLMQQRIRLLKEFVEFFKLRPVDLIFFRIRYGGNLNSTAQMLCNTLNINILFFKRLCLPLLGDKEYGSDKSYDDKNTESYQNAVKYFESHCFSPFTPHGEIN